MRLKLCLLLVFFITYSWSQTTKIFNANDTFPVPAGVTSINVQAWGGGGSGGGASGAPLLLGRGAAGGGGGAYASAPISVTAGTTLNVVVAAQTAGTSGNGKAGGSSTITGFESSILAAGGSGGAANNAGGTPVGGAGGTVAASVGSTKFAGANGGNGNSWNLLGLLLSSGAGGNGANSGGAGGAVVSGLILSNAPGNAGSAPGGAGSGGINSALGAAQSGGAGGAGRVIISYTCSTFNVSGTAATDICASTGSTSTVTLTSSAGSLPVGNYVVTYNRSNPSATGLTANLTVTTAGTGTFTAVGLTTIGSSTITITNLTSGTCSSNITTNNTATVTISPASVGGIVSGSTTINPGDPTGFMALSGHTGSVVKWQSSESPFTTWIDLAGTQNVISLYFSTLSVTTKYRAVVQSGACSVEYSTSATITVRELPTITLAASAQSICTYGSATTTTLSYSATTGSPTTYSIGWNSSPTNSFATVTNAALPVSPITIAVPAGTADGTYTGTLTVKNANGDVSIGSVFTLKVRQSATIISNNIVTPVYSSTSAQTTTLSYSGILGSPTGYGIGWEEPVMGSQNFHPFTFSTSGGVIDDIQVPANVPPGTYYGAIGFLDSEGCSIDRNISLVINPVEIPTIALADFATDACSSTNAQTTQISYKGTTGSPTTYSIVWNSSPTNDFVAVTDAALPASPITIDVPAGAAPGTYTGTLTVKNAGGGISTGSNFSVVVNETPTLTTEGVVSTTCSTNAAQLTFLEYTESTGNPTSYSIDWDSTANAALLEDEPSTANTFDPNGGSIDIKVPANVVPGTYSGILTINNLFCAESQPIILKIITGAVGGAVTGGTTIASGSTSGLLTLSGHDGTVVVWESSVSPFTEWTEIENTAVTYTSEPLTETTQFRALVRKGLCDAFSEPTTVTVEDLPTITLSDSTSEVCVFPGSNGAVFQYSATTENPITYSVVWNSTPTNNFVPVTDAALLGFGIIIPIPEDAAPGTYGGTLTVKNANGITSDPVAIVVKVGRFPGLTTNGVIATVSASASAQTTTLEYSDLSGPPIAYSIDWNNAANAAFLQDQPSTPFTDTSGGGIISTIEVSANAQPGTYTGRLRLDGIGGCINLSQQVTLKINPAPAPTITLASDTMTICGSSSYFAQLPYTGTTGNPVTYSLVWSSSPPNSFEPVTDEVLPANAIDIFINGSPADGTYQATLTVKNANGDVSSPIVITVNVETTPNFQTEGNITSVTTSTSAQTTTLDYDTVFANPLGYSIDWNASANTALLQDQPYTAFDFSPGSGFIDNVVVSANVPPGTYNCTLTVRGAFCGINTKSVTLVVNSSGARGTINSISQIEETSKSDKNSISVSTFNKVINIETIEQKINKVLVYDASGNLVYKKDGVGNSKLSIDNLRPDNQVLVVKVILDNNETKTKKVIY